MPTSEFLPFATASGANVLAQADYASLAQRPDGFSSGLAKSIEINKVLRQSAFMAAALAQVVADYSGQNVPDDGDLAAAVARIKAGLDAIFATDTALNSAISAEVTARASADTALNSSIVSVNNARLVAEADLSLTRARELRPGTNVSYIGWDGSSMDAQIDATYLGKVFTAQSCPSFLGANGYQKLATGLIIQWGSQFGGDIVNSTAYSATFPIAFPNFCLTAVASAYTNSNGSFSLISTSFNAAGVAVTFEEWNTPVQQVGFHYIAVGY